MTDDERRSDGVQRYCGNRGFAGPTCCILDKGHDGKHKYGVPPSGMKVLREQIATLESELDETKILYINVCGERAELRTENAALKASLYAVDTELEGEPHDYDAPGRLCKIRALREKTFTLREEADWILREAALKEEVAEMKPYSELVNKLNDDQVEIIRDLRAEVERLREDRERLDKLIDIFRHAKDPRWSRDNFITPCTDDEVRKTLDAAKADGAGEGE